MQGLMPVSIFTPVQRRPPPRKASRELGLELHPQLLYFSLVSVLSSEQLGCNLWAQDRMREWQISPTSKTSRMSCGVTSTSGMRRLRRRSKAAGMRMGRGRVSGTYLEDEARIMNMPNSCQVGSRNTIIILLKNYRQGQIRSHAWKSERCKHTRRRSPLLLQIPRRCQTHEILRRDSLSLLPLLVAHHSSWWER